jgi:hypothetical protein
MSLSNPSFSSIAAHQEQLVFLEAGTELRCVAGQLTARFVHSGVTQVLFNGQAVRIADAQPVRIEAVTAAHFSVQTETAPADQAQKNRQGLMGLWRSLAARLMVRRGPRAA